MATCRQCGTDFEAQRSSALYCSTKCRVYAHRGVPGVGKPDETPTTARRARDGDASKQADPARAQLSATAQQKLEAAIRAAKRKLEIEFEARVQAQVRIELEPLLEMYRTDHETHRRVIDAYRGALTKQQYRTLRGALHSDSYSGLPADQRQRMDKGFHIVEDKRLELCGEDDAPLSGTMPKSVDELLKRRKVKW